jgi:glucokinase
MSAECVIGLDLGGTKLRAAVVGRDLAVRHRASRSSREGDALELLAAAVGEVAELAAGAGEEVVAAGLGIPSLVDRATGTALWTNHLDLAGVPVRDVLSERLGLRVAVDNDANAALLAEHRVGAAVGARHALLLTLGTGIGGAALVDGALLRGAHGAAGELGHVVVAADGPPCPGNCPNRGCLEAMASGTALARAGERAAERWPDSGLGRELARGRALTGALVTELAHDGDAAAVEAVAEVGRWLGVGLSGLVNVFDPEVVVVGGGVIRAGDLLLDPAREELAARALPPIAERARVVPAALGEESGMIGAALLAWDEVDRG